MDRKQLKDKHSITPSSIVHYNSSHQFRNSFRSMSAMRECNTLCDVVFNADGEKIYAHRVVLSSLSPYFKAMFTSAMTESTQREIVINGIDAKTLKSIVEYAYTATIEITEDNVQLLLPAASILQFEEIRRVCCGFLRHRLNIENCLGVKTFAGFHGCTQLESAAAMFSQSHFSEVCKKEEFLCFSADQLKELLSSDHLNVATEFEVFQALIYWVQENKEERQKYVADLIGQIRLPLLTVKELLQDVGKISLILDDPKCVEMLLLAVEHHLLPSMAKVCVHV